MEDSKPESQISGETLPPADTEHVEARPGSTSQQVKFLIGDEEGDQQTSVHPRKPLPQLRAPITSHPSYAHSTTGSDLVDRDSTDLSDVSSLSSNPVRGRQQRAGGRAANCPSQRTSDSASSSHHHDDGMEPLLPSRGAHGYSPRKDDVPLGRLRGWKGKKRQATVDEETGGEENVNSESPTAKDNTGERSPAGPKEPNSTSNFDAEAHRLVRAMTNRFGLEPTPAPALAGPSRDPLTDQSEAKKEDQSDADPLAFKPGILSMLLKLSGQHNAAASVERGSNSDYQQPTCQHEGSQAMDLFQHLRSANSGTATSSTTAVNTPSTSGVNTPLRTKWYKKPSQNISTSSLAGLLDASMMMGAAATGDKTAPGHGNQQRPLRPYLPKSKSSGALSTVMTKLAPKQEKPEDLLITVHIAEVLSRQRYLLILCKALMVFGAPTHRLEEYMRASARALQIDGQFLYIPGCMIISFDDNDLHTTEMKIVKTDQGVDLAKFRDTFDVYKEVIHDVIGVEEAIDRLEQITKRPAKFTVWVRILMYGCASACVGPFAFGARPIDMPIAFVLGCMLGVLQLYIAPKSEMYSNVFEITASIITSMVARGIGSITHKGIPIFCFSALAQSSIALILPGYIILCASLELGTRNLVAGSVRLVYAIIYALMLGFGITVGTAVWGLLDRKAVTTVSCPTPENMDWWTKNPLVSRFPFVPLFTMCLIIINQAKWKQAPVMLLISFAGYQVNYWSAQRFSNNVQIANALGALAIGVIGNLYSRLRHGLAAAALLPAIFVQVPSGLAASGSLVSGLESAKQITGNATGVSVISNGTQGFADAQYEDQNSSDSSVYSGTVFNLGYGMVQVAIGISVGLFLSALLVYPFGKKRSGLFSF